MRLVGCGGGSGCAISSARLCRAHGLQVNLLLEGVSIVAPALADSFIFRLEHIAESQLVPQTGLPACLCPPANQVLADALEPLVAARHLLDPVREEVYVRVAVRSQHLHPGVLPHERMPDQERLLVLHPLLQTVHRHGKDQLRQAISYRARPVCRWLHDGRLILL